MKNINIQSLFIQIFFLLTIVIQKTVEGIKLNPNGVNLDVVQIFGVSTSISELNYAPKGSIKGGTKVYVTCINHDMVASNNSINIGPYPCIIPEKGVGENTITCITTEAFDPLRRSNQPVELFVRDKAQSICSQGKCLYSYDSNITPVLRFVQPSVSVPKRDVTWNGIFRVSNTIDIHKFILRNEKHGEFNCNRMNLNDLQSNLNLNDDQIIDDDSYQDVQCAISDEQIAGLYEVYVENRWGDSIKLKSTEMVTVDGLNTYSFILTAEISEVSSNTGGNNGNIIQIKGAGFGYNSQDVTINAGGLNCEIQNINNEEISCKIESGDSDQNQIIKGQGLRLTTYKFNGDSNNLKTNIENGSLDDKVLQDIQYGNWEIATQDQYTGAYLRGFVKVPRTGIYNFWLASDDSSTIYLNTNPGVASQGVQILNRNRHSYKRNYYFPSSSGNKSDDIELEQDQYYWLEAYYTNGGGGGSFALSLEAPQHIDENAITSNTVNEMYNYRFKPESINQIYEVIVKDDKAFGFLFEKKDDKRKILYSKKTEEKLASEWTDSELASAIKGAIGYNTLVRSEQITDGVKYQIEFTQYRTGNRSMKPQFTQNMSSSSINLYQQQYGRLSSGYYNLAVNGYLVEVYTSGKWTDQIPYNVGSGTIVSGLKRLFDEWSIEGYHTGNAYTGYTIYLNMKTNSDKLKGDVTFQFDNQIVTDRDISPELIENAGHNREASDRIFYEPIPYDMSYQETDKSSIQVTVNGVLSAIKQGVDNSYVTNESLTPILSGFTAEDNDSTLLLDLSSNSQVLSSELSIYYAGSECSNIDSSDSSAVSCELLDSPEGGNHIPVVFFQGLGYAKVEDSVQPVNRQVTISSISPNSGSIQGGIQITIDGTNFVNNQNIENLQVLFGTAQANIVSSNNGQIIVDLPATTDDYSSTVKVIVSVNGEQNQDGNNDFQYTDSGLPVVNSIIPSKSSPVVKNTLTINGIDFGTEINDIQVFLFKDDAVAYDLIIQSVNDVQIQATLSGGHVGIYKLVVKRDGKGFSIQDIEFSYQIEIHSVQPIQGGNNGGTLLTISGQNFSEVAVDNNVFLTFGSEMINEQCVVQTASNSEITCLTPKRHEEFTGTLNIYVQGRLIEESICNGNCQFTYEDDLTPVLESDQVFEGAKNGNEITVKGSNFGSNTEQVKVIFEENIVVIGQIVDENTITFIVPDVEEGTYIVDLQLSGERGNAGQITVIVPLVIDSIQLDRNISQGGEDLIINGSGFSVEYSQIWIEYTWCIITDTVTPSQIKCRSPILSNNTFIKLVYFHELDRTITVYKNIEKKADSNLTPVIVETIPSANQEIKASNLISIQVTENLKFDQGQITGFLSNYNDYTQQYLGNLNGSTFNFSDIPIGEYIFNVHIEGLGYAINTPDSLRIVKIVQNNDQHQIPSVKSSLIGQEPLIINGLGFDYNNVENNEIDVCGYPCIVSENTTFDSLECQLPAIDTLYVRDKKRVNVVPQSAPVESEEDIYDIDLLILEKGKGQSIQQKKSKKDKKKKKDKAVAYQMADNLDSVSVLFDNKKKKAYQSMGENTCFAGFSYKENIRFQVESIQFQTLPQGDSNAQKLIGGKFQGSNDGITYEDIYVIGNDFSQGKTVWVAETPVDLYRFIRFYNEVEEGKIAYCGLTELDVKGYVYYNEEINDETDFKCDVDMIINGLHYQIPQGVTYKGTLTPYVENIEPDYGWQLGGTEVTITGRRFGTNQNQASVFIDGIQCNIQSVNDSEIVCITGDKGADNYAKQSLSVNINGYEAVVPDHIRFLYGLLWSEQQTWGLEVPPREGDSVFVAAGQTLIVDVDSAKYINALIVEGTIFFADTGNDLNFHVKYFIVRKGRIIIGTEQKPYQSNLTITLYGNYWDKQLPNYGVKVIACYKCTMDMHGTEKLPTWSWLQETANKSDTTITIDHLTNWVVGDRLAIATTDFDGRHSEEVFITAITHDASGDVIEFSPALKYKHISEIEDYNGKELKMQAEVANLSRNVVIQGDPEDNVQERFGGQVMLHGEGSIGRIEQIEMRFTGQPRIIGRYTLHFHMVGECSQSYVRGIAVHHSYARLVALHDIHHLRILNNVGYLIRGHNIFLENGIETFNVIEGNLLISPRSVFNMLQTDITVAGIWATNPQNYVRFNHIAGSEFYGLWYEIFARPESPQATNDICPMGLPVLQLENNVAHSNARFGLRFFRLQPRQFPCQAIRNDSLEDPWSLNPSIETNFRNHTLYKNGQSGVLAEEMGNSIFSDFILADNHHSGFQAHLTNFTREEVVFQDSVVIGRSISNSESIDYHAIHRSNAILTSRTDGFRAKNIEVFNFGEGTSIVEVSSQNSESKLFVQGGKTVNIENISIENSDNAMRVRWTGPEKNIVYDVDGSLSGTGKATYITHYEKHLQQPINDGLCTYDSDTIYYYDNSILCPDIKLKTIQIGSLQEKSLFLEQKLRVVNLNTDDLCFNNTVVGTETVCEENLEDFSINESKMILNKKMDGKDQYSNVYAEGYAYNLHWESRLDWSHLLVYLPQIYDVSDKTIILRFNYTEQRELFDVYNMKIGKLDQLYNQVFNYDQFYDTDGKPNNNGCKLGEYYIDYDLKVMSLCINNKERTTPFQSVDVNGVYCRFTCPVYGLSCEKEVGNPRLFQESSSVEESQWESLAVRKRPEDEEWTTGIPQQGDDVIIPCEWTITFNIAEFEFGTLIVDGILKFDLSLPEITIRANNIWVRAGTITAGSKLNPISNKINFILYGNRHSPPIVIDDISRTGTKSFAVTGKLDLHAPSPIQTQTRLGKTANFGEKTIQLDQNTDISDWNIGDELVLGGSQLDGLGFEKVEIISINQETKIIGIKDGLQYYHYGAEKISMGNEPDLSVSENDKLYYQHIESNYGQGLDMRTTVGHITRNIKIVGTDEDETGGHLQVYYWKFYEETKYSTTDIDARGSIVLNGVELENMGQVNSENAGIHILNTYTQGDKSDVSIIQNSSIHDCVGICMNFIDAHHTQVSNNIIYSGEQFLYAHYGFYKSVVQDNLFIGALNKRYGATAEPATFIYMYENYDVTDDGILVTGNVGQSSQGLGFAFPSIPCDDKQKSRFYQNESGNAKQVGIIYNMKSSGCRYGGNNAIYHSKEGISVHSKGTTSIGWLLEKHIIVECNVGMILRSGSMNERTHYNTIRDTYVSAMVLQDSCPECYNSQNNQQHFRCSNSFGAQLLLTNQIGNACPLENGALGLKAICNVPTAFSQMFIYDSEFVNYKKEYSSDDYPQLQANVCGSNKAFRTNKDAVEVQSAHYLRNVKCTNCHRDGLIFLNEPKPEQRGWFGGCGIMDCTGLENVLVQDLTGDFLGQIGSIISNNEQVAYGGDMRDSCQFVTEWNGFNCTRTDITVLEWESIGPDAKTISTAPVTVTNDQFTNTVNMWREWEWIGPEPQNLRQNTFTSLVLANQWHNITYAGAKSFDLIHKLSQRSPTGEEDKNRFVIIKYHYSNPLAIDVLVQGNQIDTFPFQAPEDLNQYSNVCGANNYYYQNSTIHFVITNVPECQVQVRLRNFVQLNMRIGMTKEEFFSDNAKQTSFVNRIAAFLNIPFDRIRIVGIINNNRRILQEDEQQDQQVGQAELLLRILGSAPGTQETNYKYIEEYVSLQQEAEILMNGINDGSLSTEIPILQASYKVVVAKEAGKGDNDIDYVTELDVENYNSNKDGQKLSQTGSPQIDEKDQQTNSLLGLAIGIISGLFIIMVITLISYHLWKNKKLKQISNEVPESLKIEDLSSNSDMDNNTNRCVDDNGSSISLSNDIKVLKKQQRRRSSRKQQQQFQV